MDIMQIGALLGSVVVIVGLLQAHKVVVERHVLPQMDFEEEEEDSDDGERGWAEIRK